MIKRLFLTFVFCLSGFIIGYFLVKDNVFARDVWLSSNEDVVCSEQEQNVELEKAMKAYYDFLNGNICVEGVDMDFITIPTREENKRYATEYVIADANGDNIPDLHVKSARYYYIFSYLEDELVIFKDMSSYRYCYPLKNGGFIRHVYGGAPEADYYCYFVFDNEGNLIEEISFSKYDSNENHIYDENDEYVFLDEKVTKEEWERLTEEYIYMDENGVERERNTIEMTAIYDNEYSGSGIIDYKEVFTFEGAITQDNINEIAKCENLKYLDVIITSEDIDLSPLSNLIYLQKLSLTFEGNTADLSFLKELDNLTDITIIGCCELADLSVLENKVYLRKIHIEYVGDVDLNFLTNCTSLKEIYITGGCIRNVEGISGLTHLQTIYLFDNSGYSKYEEQVEWNMNSFSNMKELRWMLLANIKIEDVSPLAKLTNLREIILVRPDINDIKELSYLPNLSSLSIYGNENEVIEKQAEKYFDNVENVIVTEDIPDQLNL